MLRLSEFREYRLSDIGKPLALQGPNVVEAKMLQRQVFCLGHGMRTQVSGYSEN